MSSSSASEMARLWEAGWPVLVPVPSPFSGRPLIADISVSVSVLVCRRAYVFLAVALLELLPVPKSNGPSRQGENQSIFPCPGSCSASRKDAVKPALTVHVKRESRLPTYRQRILCVRLPIDGSRENSGRGTGKHGRTTGYPRSNCRPSFRLCFFFVSDCSEENSAAAQVLVFLSSSPYERKREGCRSAPVRCITGH